MRKHKDSRPKSLTRAKSLCALALLPVLYLAGCATSAQPTHRSGTPALQHADSAAHSSAPTLEHSRSPVPPGDNGDMQRLADLWLKRSNEKANTDFPIGPGDVLEISVPAIEELRSRTVRISGDGTIALPFVGKLKAAGLTEEELQQGLVERLKQYMYAPRVIVFVKEYRSRQVAVLGAVSKPGLYNVTNGADTLMDLLSQAGGIAPGADPKVYLIAAEQADKDQHAQIASLMPQTLLQQDPAPLILKRTDPILIDVKQISFGGNQQYLSLPVRPGDVIMVPSGGQVLVEGWVEKPGAYGLSPGLTVAGVVVQAGGPLYPAEVNNVKIIRPEKGGSKSFLYADLEKIKRGDAPDIPLQGGDIVEISAVNSKLVAYSFYRFFSTVVNIGVGANIPVFR
jgi:polysaccharide export outer membrane protein